MNKETASKTSVGQPPGISEVATRLNQILDRSSVIEDRIRTLEILKEEYRKSSDLGGGEQKRQPIVDEYGPFANCCERICKPVPRIRRSDRLSGSDKHALCMIMDLINDLRRNVSNLATRQNQMQNELEGIRARLC